MPMRFPYLKAARVKLQERKNACLRADYASAEIYTRQFLAFAHSDPIVRTVVCELSIIAEAKFSDIANCVDVQRHCLILPTDRAECAAYHLRLMERLADPDPKAEIPGFTMIFGGTSSKYQDMFR